MTRKPRDGHIHLIATNVPEDFMWKLREQAKRHKCRDWKSYLRFAYRVIALGDELAERDGDGRAGSGAGGETE